MKKIIIANWKLNPASVEQAVRLARAVGNSKNAEVVIAPPFVFLEAVGRVLKPKTYNLKPKLGAQNVFWEEKGAYTGEVSPRQLKSLGVSYVIVGHSERRALGETDEIINRKVKAALKEGLKVILCVGEPWSVRRKGLASAKKFIKNQLSSVVSHKSLVIAYEPVWAIGTSRADKPADTVEMVKYIKSLVVSRKSSVKVLYGGSVNAKNAKKFLENKEIDGALVGGASLKAGEFEKIILSSP